LGNVTAEESNTRNKDCNLLLSSMLEGKLGNNGEKDNNNMLTPTIPQQ
jgi:hypothetical protein